jgi:hypothetical protein
MLNHCSFQFLPNYPPLPFLSSFLFLLPVFSCAPSPHPFHSPLSSPFSFFHSFSPSSTSYCYFLPFLLTSFFHLPSSFSSNSFILPFSLHHLLSLFPPLSFCLHIYPPPLGPSYSKWPIRHSFLRSLVLSLMLHPLPFCHPLPPPLSRLPPFPFFIPAFLSFY